MLEMIEIIMMERPSSLMHSERGVHIVANTASLARGHPFSQPAYLPACLPACLLAWLACLPACMHAWPAYMPACLHGAIRKELSNGFEHFLSKQEYLGVSLRCIFYMQRNWVS